MLVFSTIYKFSFSVEWYFGIIISVVGFYTFGQLVEHRRLENDTQKVFKAHKIILVLASVVFATTTWCHYAFSLASLSLLAYETDGSSSEFNAEDFLVLNKNSIPNSLISTAVGFGAAFFSLFVSSRDQFFSSTNDQRVDMLRAIYRTQTRKATIRDLKRQGKSMVRVVALTRRTLRHLVSGGIIAASQLFTRLLMFRNASEEIMPSATFHLGYIAFVWAIASFLSFIGIWGYFRLLSWKRYESLRFGSAVFLWASAMAVEWLSLGCISFAWPSTASPMTYLSVDSSTLHHVWFSCLGATTLMIIISLWTMNLELRDNYLLIMTDFAKLINLMDAAYVSGHVTHNFERSFETFINSALPLMATHTKITEAAFENYELSRSRNNSEESNTTFSRRSNTPVHNLNSKMVKILGSAGAQMADLVSRAKNSFYIKKLSKSFSFKGLRDFGASLQLPLVGSARNYVARSSSQRVVLPVDNDTAMQTNIETQIFKRLNSARQNVFISPRVFEKKTSQRIVPVDESGGLLFTNIEPPHATENPVSLLRNEGRLCRKASSEFVSAMSTLNSSLPKSFGNASFREPVCVSSKKDSVVPEPACTNIIEVADEVLPSPINVKHPSVPPRRKTRKSRCNSDGNRSLTPESLLEKIARYQETEKRRSKSPERSNLPTCAGVLNLILDNPRLSISKANNQRGSAGPVITGLSPPRTASLGLMASIVHLTNQGSATDASNTISRTNRPKALSAESKPRLSKSIPAEIVSPTGAGALDQDLMSSGLSSRRNSSDSNLLSRSSRGRSLSQSINSIKNSSRKSSEASKFSQLIFPHLELHGTRRSIRRYSSDPNLQHFVETTDVDSLLPTDASLSGRLGTRGILSGRKPVPGDLDASGNSCSDSMCLQSMSPGHFDLSYTLAQEKPKLETKILNERLESSCRMRLQTCSPVSVGGSSPGKPMEMDKFSSRRMSSVPNHWAIPSAESVEKEILDNRTSLSSDSSGKSTLSARKQNSKLLPAKSSVTTSARQGSESNLH